MPTFAPSTGGLFGAPTPSEKKPEEDKPQGSLFGPISTAPIASELFGTTTPAPATGALLGAPSAT